MFFYNIMASHKTNKRSYKKRTPKRKTQKGGNALMKYFCGNNEAADDGEADDGEADDGVKVDDEDGKGQITGEGQFAEKKIFSGGKKGRKSRKSTKKGRKPHKKNRKTMKKKKKSAWTTFVVDLYNKNKVKTKGYMFKNALSDAAKIYKK